MNFDHLAFKITVTRHDPGAAPVTVVRADFNEWDLDSANKYVMDQARTRPAETKVTIGIEVWCGSVEQIQFERCVEGAVKYSTNLRDVARELDLSEELVAGAVDQEAAARAIVKAALAASHHANAIVNAFLP